ncbi:MAG TPA: hypothetical protein VNL16_07915 [Chloroflexota bacterium]|nr:hypothetical protein [Chloroflexota bacterium]
MNVDYAFLADMAQAAPDGKINAIGAGIDRILATSFPTVQPMLAFVVRINVAASECDHEHKLEVQLWDPDGARIGPQLNGSILAHRDPQHPTRAAHAQLAMMMIGIPFHKAGDYAFHILVDGHEQQVLPLFIEIKN